MVVRFRERLLLNSRCPHLRIACYSILCWYTVQARSHTFRLYPLNGKDCSLSPHDDRQLKGKTGLVHAKIRCLEPKTMQPCQHGTFKQFKHKFCDRGFGFTPKNYETWFWKLPPCNELVGFAFYPLLQGVWPLPFTAKPHWPRRQIHPNHFPSLSLRTTATKKTAPSLHRYPRCLAVERLPRPCNKDLDPKRMEHEFLLGSFQRCRSILLRTFWVQVAKQA